ncbi:MAG: hypothetical protein K0V04_12705 [Deltaproteobacteria bacterium]|nr:hypothetical protein [Deltaproteobacteria bacterium]
MAPAVRRRCTILVLAVATVPLTACDSPLPLDPDPPSTFRKLAAWPPTMGTLNTAWLGGMRLMRLLPPQSTATPTPGDVVVTLLELDHGAARVFGTSVDAPAGNLTVTTAQGDLFEQQDLLGSTWWINEEQGKYLVITDYEGEDTHRYRFEAGTTQTSGHKPVCAPNGYGDAWAYVVADVHAELETSQVSVDPGALLIACVDGALGKSIEWGFSPWTPPPADLTSWQTGIRAIRADYCGDGVAHTETGTAIQIASYAAELEFEFSASVTEAVFGPDGALCLSQPRIPLEGALGCVLPACDDQLGNPPSALTSPELAWTKALLTNPQYGVTQL